MAKLYWKVSPQPTGRFRSFEKRGFPYAYYKNGEMAARIDANVSYDPSIHRTANDLQISVFVAEWYVREVDSYLTFRWRKAKSVVTSISAAKELVNTLLKSNPNFVHPDHREA